MLYKVSVVEKGVRYSGHYEVVDGEVRIISAYGSPSGPVGTDAAVTAVELLLKAVAERRP